MADPDLIAGMRRRFPAKAAELAGRPTFLHIRAISRA
jgi:hypothetical protein